jgi:hypothetical protein
VCGKILQNMLVLANKVPRYVVSKAHSIVKTTLVLFLT